ncbi:hypothetical protein GW17_00031895 [Ensete ventricosum]|nr:hypothetical protein GW17_00031895 [Ensete ventricosum]
MRKQSVIVPEELAVTTLMAVVADPAAHHSALLPPRSSAFGVRCARYKRFLSQLDMGSGGGGGARISAWVDSMRASSPTHVKAAAMLSASFAASHDEDYNKWVVRFAASSYLHTKASSPVTGADGNCKQKQHPSALTVFEDIVAASKGKQIVMFLDYDGTLSPIVDDPDRAFISNAVRSVSFVALFPSSVHTQTIISLHTDEGDGKGRSKAFPNCDCYTRLWSLMQSTFQVLHGRRQGLGILVSGVIRETSACCSLRQPAEVSIDSISAQAFLPWMLQLLADTIYRFRSSCAGSWSGSEAPPFLEELKRGRSEMRLKPSIYPMNAYASITASSYENAVKRTSKTVEERERERGRGGGGRRWRGALRGWRICCRERRRHYPIAGRTRYVSLPVGNAVVFLVVLCFFFSVEGVLQPVGWGQQGGVRGGGSRPPRRRPRASRPEVG